MLLSAQGLDLRRFDPAVRATLRDFDAVVAEAILTHAPRVMNCHFLTALAKVPDGYTQQKFAEKGIEATVLVEALAQVIAGPSDVLSPVEGLCSETVTPSVQAMLTRLEEIGVVQGTEVFDERHLLCAVLAELDPEIAELLHRHADINAAELSQEISREFTQAAQREVFAQDSEELLETNFDRSGRKVLALLKNEAEGLGLENIPSLVLLLALVAIEDSITQQGLRAQLQNPKAVHERIMSALRARATKKSTNLRLGRSCLHLSVQRTLEQAAIEAAKDAAVLIGESHILRAFLAEETTGIARRTLHDLRIDVEALAKFARDYYEPAEAEAETHLLPLQEIGITLRAEIVGQERVIQRIMPLIKRLRFHYPREGKPAGVFLFLGKSGTGKTQLAKALARVVYGSEDNLIMLEMGQFSSKESKNIFVGAPPGYVGYGEGKLTNGLRDKPQSVVLFDEIEKCSEPTVFDALLRFLDEGKIDDPGGPVRDGRHCLIVLTSNIGADRWKESAFVTERGEITSEEDVVEVLKADLLRYLNRPEFFNRVDEIILFNPLAPQDFHEITRRQIAADIRRLRDEKEIDLEVDDLVYDLIARRGYARNEGARAIMKEITKLVINPLIDLVGENGRVGRKRVRLWRRDQEIVTEWND